MTPPLQSLVLLEFLPVSVFEKVEYTLSGMLKCSCNEYGKLDKVATSPLIASVKHDGITGSKG